MFKNLKLGIKIGGGYAIMVLVLVTIVLLTILQVSRVKEVNHRIMDLRAPTACASLSMLNGINHSLAALRGWMILGNDKFKTERTEAWNTEIEPALKTLQKFAVNWTNPENVQRLKNIEEVIGEFKAAQQKIEDIAQTPENVPAVKLTYTDAAPLVEMVKVHITDLIDLELQQPGTPERKQFLGVMADLRGTVGMALSAIQAYLATGDPKYKEQFQQYHIKNEKRFTDFKEIVHLHNPEQEKHFAMYTEAMEKLSPIIQQILAAREADDWNRANYWLGTEAAPRGAKLVTTLKAMAADQKGLMAKDEEKVQRMYDSLNRTMWILLAIGVLACVFLGVAITRAIVKPVHSAMGMIKAVEQGDLQQQITVNSSDEIGQMGLALNKMSANLRNLIGDISHGVDTLNNTSSELSDLSIEMSANSEETNGRSQTVSAAAEEMSVNMDSVATASEETSVNVDMVAAAAEEMSTTIKEIASNTEKTSSITDTAVAKSKKASEQIHELGSAAQEVGKVTESITEISEQTNLLALNATIEAARAGEAGKGFAVVANEIKDLAKQTAEATNEIKGKISKIQDATRNAVADITEITGVIGDVNEMVSVVSVTVEEQAGATQEIASNVGQASISIQEVNENVAQASSVTGEVAADIAEVGHAAQELSTSSSQVSTNAGKLEQLSKKLAEAVEQFKV